MSVTAEKPGIVERLGSALQSTNLAPNAERDVPIDLIAALGMLQANIDGEAHGGRETTAIDPRAELGAVLLRIKYGGDNTLGERAVHLLVRWIRAQRTCGKWKLGRHGESMLERFARQGLAEWLYPVCPVCHGRQVLGIARGEVVERRVRCSPCRGDGAVARKQGQVRFECTTCRGFGWIAKRRIVAEKPRTCTACSGSGSRVKGIEGERMRALGIPENAYVKFWERRFSWLAGAFDRIDDLEKRGLQIQMSRRTTQPSSGQ